MTSNKIKLVFVISSLMHGGIQKVLYDIVTSLKDSRFECHVISFVKENSPYVFDDSVKVHYLFPKPLSVKSKSHLLKALKISKTIYRLKKRLAAFPKDSIIIPFMARPTAAYTVAAQLFSARPVIVSLHTAESAYMNFHYKTIFQRLKETLLLRFACAGADMVIANSHEMLSDLVFQFSIPPQKICVIPNPIDSEKIQAQVQNGTPVDYCINDNPILFVHIGRLSIEKNHDLLLQAIGLLKSRIKRCLLVCAGSGNQENIIKYLIKKRGLENNVRLAGALDNPYPLISKARALILSSHYESYGMVLAEAMAVGTPVISVDCPYGPRNILRGGKSGILVPPNNPELLAEAMYDISMNDFLFEELREKGRQRIREFDISIIKQMWIDLLLKKAKTMV